MKNLIYGFLGIFLLVGCVTTGNTYVPPTICHEVPPSPSFVVIPFNNYQIQILSAEYIEKALIALGIRVKQPPGIRHVETKTKADQSKSMLSENGNRVGTGTMVSSGAIQASTMRIERYSTMGDIDADYVITSNGKYYYYEGAPSIENISVRIIKRETNEIVSVFETYPDYVKYELYDVLNAMGVKAIKPE